MPADLAQSPNLSGIFLLCHSQDVLRLQVRIIGEVDVTLQPALDLQQLLTVGHGAPRVHISKVRFLGRLRAEGGNLTLLSCSFEEPRVEVGSSLLTGQPQVERALSISSGGHATLVQTVLRGHSAGALVVHAATLSLIDCIIRDSHALSGGAVLVSGGSNLTVIQSRFIGNSATESGGALQVSSRKFDFGHQRVRLKWCPTLTRSAPNC